jgi:Na+-driven multidrug efflux pump
MTLMAAQSAAFSGAPWSKTHGSHRRCVPHPFASAASTTPRWKQALPGRGDSLDKEIMRVALPSIANLAVIPIVGAVDTLWVGRMGNALALAGQGAANQIFFSTFFLIAFIPTITAPLVAKAAGGGDIEGAAKRVCEALFLANVLGAIGTLLLVLRPTALLSVVLPASAPAASYAASYLRLRSISLVPSLVASIGFAAFRGLLDNVTPLKVSLASNLINLILDPLLQRKPRSRGRGARDRRG